MTKKSTNELISRNLTKEHIHNNFKEYKHIYTDGSKKNRQVGAGFFCETTNSESCIRLDDGLAITSAELVAIDMALEYALELVSTEDKGVAIFTDSKAAIQSIIKGIRGAERPDLIKNIYIRYKKLMKKTKNAQIIWIPAHVGIPGNDRADSAAKKGREQQTRVKKIGLSPNEIKSLTKPYIKTIWQNQWDQHKPSNIRKFRQIVPNVNTKIPHENIDTKINRLRVNTAAFRTNDRKLSCDTCSSLVTVDHVLLACPDFANQREIVYNLLNKHNITMTTTNILGLYKNRTINRAVRNLINSIDDKHYI